MSIELSGNSGCNISIINDGGVTFVRKTSPNKGYNNRLKTQFVKQKKYRHKSMNTTPIISSGFDDHGLFFFDMLYVNGVSLSKYMSSAPLTELSSIANILSNGFDNPQKYDGLAKSIFDKKIESVMKNVYDNEIIKNKSFRYKSILLDAETLLSGFEWSYVIKSECHGDFTLENIIVSNKGLYIIDLLDSFYDSWMIDAAKLFQDLELGWSYRFGQIDENLSIRLLITRNKIVERITSLPDGDELLKTIWHILLLNILRIIPYTNDDFTMNYLVEKIVYLLRKIG